MDRIYNMAIMKKKKKNICVIFQVQDYNTKKKIIINNLYIQDETRGIHSDYLPGKCALEEVNHVQPL